MKKSIISTEINSSARTLGEEKAIEAVAKAGFDAWDFSMFKNVVVYTNDTRTAIPADHPLAGKNYLSFARQLKKVGEDNGIFCNQSHAPFPTHCKQIRDAYKRCLELTAEAGGKICIIHPDNDKTPEENGEMYLELLPFAKSVGVKIATENMWNWDYDNHHALPAACSDHENFLAHINAVNDDYLVACLDIGHAEMKGLNTSVPQMIRTLDSHLQALHIHDNDKMHDYHWLPFEKNIDFLEMVRELKAINYKGDFTMEADAYVSKHPDLIVALKNLATTARKIADEFDNL